jgi:hypothetical protein
MIRRTHIGHTGSRRVESDRVAQIFFSLTGGGSNYELKITNYEYNHIIVIRASVQDHSVHPHSSGCIPTGCKDVCLGMRFYRAWHPHRMPLSAPRHRPDSPEGAASTAQGSAL